MAPANESTQAKQPSFPVEGDITLLAKSTLRKLKEAGQIRNINDSRQNRSNRFCGNCESGYILRDGRAYPCGCVRDLGTKNRQSQIDTLLKSHRVGLPSKLERVTAHTFLIRPGHEHIRPALDQYIRDLSSGKKYGFFIFGEPGVGKTYAAAYVINTVRQHRITAAAMVNFPRALSALRNTFKNLEEHRALLGVLYDTPLLAIDDLGMEQRVVENPEMSWAVEQFYKVIDYRRDEELATIITSNRTVDELEDRLGAAIMSRIGALTLRLDIHQPKVR